MVKLVDFVNLKEENAKAYEVLSPIIREEVKQTDLSVFEYYPKQLALFSFCKNYSNGSMGNIKGFIKNFFVRMMNLEPVFIDGGPPTHRIRVLNNKYMAFAGRIAEKYKEKSGIEMTIEFASKS